VFLIESNMENSLNKLREIWERFPVTDEGHMLKRYEAMDKLVKETPSPAKPKTFQQKLDDACRTGNLEFLKSSFLHNEDHNVGGLQIASSYGQLEVVKYLHETRSISDPTLTTFYNACEKGHLPVVQYLVERAVAIAVNGVGSSRVNVVEGFHIACRCGHLDIVKYFVDKYHVGVGSSFQKGIAEAKTTGRNAVVEYLEDLLVPPKLTIGYQTFLKACNDGDLTTLKNANLADFHKDIGIEGLEAASRNGYLPIVQYLYEVEHITDKIGNIGVSFMLACQNGHLPVVQYLVEHYPMSVETLGGGFKLACESGYLATVKYLVSKGANIHVNDDQGYKEAKRLHHKAVVEYLEGLVGFIKPLIEREAFMYACKTGQVETFDNFRMDHIICADVESAFRDACLNGILPTVKYLVENFKNLVSQTNGFNNACQCGHLNVIKYLDAIYHFNYLTGFNHACAGGRVEVVKYMTSNGINTAYLTANNYEGYRNAKSNGHNEMMAYLETIGAAPPKPVELTKTEFLDACKTGDVTRLNSSSWPFKFVGEGFQVACQHGHVDVVKLLIDKHPTYCNMQSGFAEACKMGHVSVVQSLVERGTNIAYGGHYGFRIACTKGHLAVVKYLVSKGADIHAIQNEGFKNAKTNGHKEVTDYLSTIVFK